ncbi:MAG TPA: GNAT family N-acetyltransferase [Niallia sp.]|nr:GNAT family N-acetyltransferase [Niallia sp.]HWK23162.1 GNAT family N-acetyltransferase [Ureibacillus sp.]
MFIKELIIDDARIYWDLRLEALKASPEAFGSSYEDALQTPLHTIEERIKRDRNNYILGAFNEDKQLIGMAKFTREQGLKLKHKGTVTGVYVSSGYRGKGIAKSLIKEILSRGKEIEGLKQINLTVVSTNNVAVKLYKGLGFETYGIEKNALIYNGKGYDEELMVYFL